MLKPKEKREDDNAKGINIWKVDDCLCAMHDVW
jgi:hypothetical protein